MTKNEINLIIEFLNDYSDKLGNAGCNDYELINNEENLEMVKQAELELKKEPYITKRGTIMTYDFMLVSHLKNKLKEHFNV